MALQRNLKALGTFGYQTTTRGNPVYIQYMPRTLRYVRTNLEKYPRFARLRELLGGARRGAALSATGASDTSGSLRGYKRSFGVSTHLYHGQRLSRDHLLEIAAHGFEAVELFATRTHFDYHNPAAVADLQQWLAEAGLELHSVHAPIGESFVGGRWGAPLIAGQRRRATRARARSTKPSARCTSRGGFRSRCWSCTSACRGRSQRAPADNSRDAARRSIEELQRAGRAARRRDRGRSDPERAVAGRLARALRRRRCSTAPTSASASTSATRT